MRQVMFDIWDTITRTDNIVIFRHVRPDPDAVGSQAALKELILTAFPDKQVLLAGEEEASLTFLAHMDTMDSGNALAVICDTANQARIDGRTADADFIVKIDHHPEVDIYGDLQLVNPQASSTAEMIYQLAEVNGLEISPACARLLYAGISADTGRFRFPNATAETFRVVSRLVAIDFDRTALHQKMEETSWKIMRLQGHILSTMEMTSSGAVQVPLTEASLREYDVTVQESSALVNCFSNIEGLTAWVFFVEEGDEIRVRLRSKGPEIHHLAEAYNGGGHPMASGAAVSDWAEAEALFTELDQLCRSYRSS
ncbi:DHH family phosphoesterase [Alkalicoccus chagannorensis]|uniref:DHH family phosphoesterase n=1 Tax=Alkalicoccus chagannorensis TaxID=427072 RepID=UPI0003FB4E4E|nr:bifunctional oligoribonuclease/PAP phosphatase NrnA [Alkalicoccus chagannorensis]